MNLAALKEIFSKHVESPACRDNLLRAKWRQAGNGAVGSVNGLEYAVFRKSENVLRVTLSDKTGAGCVFHIQH